MVGEIQQGEAAARVLRHRRLGGGHRLEIAQRLVRPPPRLGDQSQAVIGLGGGQQADALLEVALGLGGATQILLQQAALQQGPEIARVERHRLVEVAQRLAAPSLGLADLAAQGAEQGLARLDGDRLVHQGQGLAAVAPLKRPFRLGVGLVGGGGAPQVGDGATVAFAAALAARIAQRREQAAVGLDALLRRRVGGEQALQPAALLVLEQAHEGLLQAHRGRRVVSRARHVAHAVGVRLQLRLAVVAALDQVGAQRGPELAELAIARVGQGHAGGHQGALQKDAALHRLGGVARRGVHDLVPQHRGQLGLVLQLQQQAAVDRDLAAGQGPGVGAAVVDHPEFVGQLAVRHPRQALPHPLDIGHQLGIGDIVAALGLAVGAVVLLADGQLLGLADQGQFLAAGDRIGGAAGEHQDQGQQPPGAADQAAIDAFSLHGHLPPLP